MHWHACMQGAAAVIDQIEPTFRWPTLLSSEGRAPLSEQGDRPEPEPKCPESSRADPPASTVLSLSSEGRGLKEQGLGGPW